MRTVSSLPHPTRVDDHVRIPMADGTELGARIWRPVSSDSDPVPAILEFLPYRLRDLTAQRDSMHHPYLAGHGYAGVRVDLRGSGDSDGVLGDEYLEQELLDAEQVLAWLTEQPWCDGNTGMMGISWGGFNALQLAARRPPGLGAIATLSSSDDRYADDVHYMGGCLLSDNLSWASVMFAYISCPPDPAVVGHRWREMWWRRLQHCEPWLIEWLRHQRRDDYWRHGSVCEDYSAVGCPVLAVSGWADGYSNAVFRLLRHLDVPCKGLIGPWSHKYPHLGRPGPAIGFLQELVRWWDHWLKGVDNGVMDDPTLRIWMQESAKPATAYEQRPGRWIGEDDWPAPHVEPTTFVLRRNRLVRTGTVGTAEEAPEEATPESLDVVGVPATGSPRADGSGEAITIESPLSVGQFAGKWCSYNAPPDLPYDQREEDGGSLVFDTGVLTERTEILGSPVVHLELSTDRPTAMVTVRLSDVSPDGRATRVSYGLLNLTHRNGHARPEPLEPGTTYRVSISLNGVAQAFPAGHRIRLSVSTSYWPLAWPPPEPVRLTVYADTSELVLPVRPMRTDEVRPEPFDEPESTPTTPVHRLRPGDGRWTVSRDLVEYRSALDVVKDLGVVHFEDIDLRVGRRADERYEWVGDDFESVRGQVDWVMRFTRGGWDVSTTTHTTLSCTPTEFVVHARLDAFEGTERVFSRNWHTAIPRDHV
ncbi:CocE/NonD family hydrolase [Saccharomonospora iraqiensis]|uniref:CocE/NonD family hydrolase n=1 Tax=Saccharomonospora iraqiensis TaxID=52698 RepID=UPI00022E1CB5|nr:CocE/NonD family hydrolase [Saccharomonospora iraqiensis]